MSARPFSAIEWSLAGRYLRAKKKESFVSVIAGFSFVGIALGVAVLIIVMSVMNGFRKELLDRILGVNGHILVQSLEGGIPDYAAAAARIRAVPGVTRVAPQIDAEVLVTANGRQAPALVRGITAADLVTLEPVAANLTDGATEAFAQGGLILGRSLAARLGVTPGMRVRLLSPDGDVTVMGRTPRSKVYPVAGLFAADMSEYDSTFIFMPLSEAQPFFNLPDRVKALEVMVADPDQVEQWRAPVLEAAPELVRVLDWKDINGAFVGALIVERNVMFLILTLIILVAALNTISGLIMLVMDKGRDIAILRTMGMSSGAILRVFFLAGSAIGFVGTLLGVVLGVVFCLNIEAIRQALSVLTGTTLFNPEIYFLSRLPAEMDPWEIGAVVLMSVSLAFVATLYPAWRAARIDPVEALRYE